MTTYSYSIAIYVYYFHLPHTISRSKEVVWVVTQDMYMTNMWQINFKKATNTYAFN